MIRTVPSQEVPDSSFFAEIGYCKQYVYCIINAIRKACTNTEGAQAKGVHVPVLFLGRSIAQAQSHQLNRSLVGGQTREEDSLGLEKDMGL